MKDRMKVYHGVPKSVTDENTIFYASFDGSIKPEIGEINIPNYSFQSCPTGYGMHSEGTNLWVDYIKASDGDLTVDTWVLCNENSKDLITLYDTSITSSPLNARTFVYYYDKSEGIKVTHMYKDSSSQIQTIIIPNTLNSGWNHIRCTASNGVARSFVNGKLVAVFNLQRPYDSVVIGSSRGYGGSSIKYLDLADLHISSIDKGDFFPNLPQDFIEGKAIIKERFGQQQIKGDPAYSQVTELKAEAGYFYDGSDKLNSCFRHETKPELRVSDSNWNNGAMLKIRGLNGEIISGVIDTDTALCKIVKDGRGTATQYVNSVEGVNVGDCVQGVNKRYITTSQDSYIVESIDSLLNTITLDRITSFYVNDFIIETTANSSSPIVKSQDGQTVVGTWRGLGTNEATFTLGENTPSLEGKDLYITYSLNIPPNNSHFPEIPYSVDKAFTETGVEMKPVTEIIIEDDFRGKNPKDELECPHFHGYNMHDNQSLPSPNQFSREYKSNYVDLIASKDGMYHTISCDTEGKYINTVFSFNLIEMVERKMGAIPSYDKVNWLRQNISMLDPKFYGFGYNSVNNRIRLVHWVASNGDWSTSEHATTNAYVTELKPSLDSKNIPMYITDGGSFIMVVQNTSPATTSASVINIDHVSISLGLKIPSNYQALYCDNKRAREDVCNPVLVQKETKTVQRLIPSKESFITESKVSRCINIVKQHPPLKDMLYQGDLMISTMGTGNTNIPPNYIELVSSLPNITKEPTYDFMSDKILSTDFTQAYQFNYSDREINNLGVCYQTPYYSYRNNGYRTLIDPTRLNRTNFISSAPYLYTKNGELTALVSNSVHKNMLYEKEELVEFKLPNRPLIK